MFYFKIREKSDQQRARYQYPSGCCVCSFGALPAVPSGDPLPTIELRRIATAVAHRRSTVIAVAAGHCEPERKRLAAAQCEAEAGHFANGGRAELQGLASAAKYESTPFTPFAVSSKYPEPVAAVSTATMPAHGPCLHINGFATRVREPKLPPCSFDDLQCVN